jgi:hypothetical protein
VIERAALVAASLVAAAAFGWWAGGWAYDRLMFGG